MLCYRDTTFCISPNCVNACGRKLTDNIAEQAEIAGLPIANSYFCDIPVLLKELINEDILDTDFTMADIMHD